MMLTPEQAAAVWCPMIRIGVLPNSGGPSAINDPTTKFHGNCVAAGCAMWRWADPAPEPRDQKTWWPDEEEPAIEPPRPAKVPADAVWIPLTGDGDDMAGGCWEEAQEVVEADNAKAAATRRGYCGLAGKPCA